LNCELAQGKPKNWSSIYNEQLAFDHVFGMRNWVAGTLELERKGKQNDKDKSPRLKHVKNEMILFLTL